jgi:phenol 2-monooxygenase (NADPH)
MLPSQYIVGADGSHSTVRSLAGITSVTDKTALRWVRVDGIVKTNLPDARTGMGLIESATHGMVIWVSLDHGATRIGYILSPALIAKYGDNLTQEQAVHEARLACAPFELEFTPVDWYTCYTVRHSVADTYLKDRVLLAGDACHSHSSGTAQGMNVGVHDAYNLSWKLSGVLKGWYKPKILDTYTPERRPIAQKVIELDKALSTLISGTIPPDLNIPVSTNATTMELAGNLSSMNRGFADGLGINFLADGLLNVYTQAATIPCGVRAPDVLVYAPGANEHCPSRLQTIMKNHGEFWVLVFTGEPLLTNESLKTFRSFIDHQKTSKSSFVHTPQPSSLTNHNNYSSAQRIPHHNQLERSKFLTLIPTPHPSAIESLGMEPWGDVYYDPSHSAYDKHGVNIALGAVIVVRPDGIVGFACGLDSGEDLREYFERIFS